MNINMNINAVIENAQKREHVLMGKFILSVAFLFLTLLIVVGRPILVDDTNVQSSSSSFSSTTSLEWHFM